MNGTLSDLNKFAGCSFTEVLRHRQLFENEIYPGLQLEACKQFKHAQDDRYGGYGGDYGKLYGILPTVYLRNELDAAEDENREMIIRYVRFPMWTNEGRLPFHTIFMVSLPRYSQRDMKEVYRICMGFLYKTIMETGEQTFSEKNPVTIWVTGKQKGWIAPFISRKYKIYCFNAKRNVLEVKARVLHLLMTLFDVRSTKLKEKTECRVFINKWTLKKGKVRLHGILLKDYLRMRGLCGRFRKIVHDGFRDLAEQRKSILKGLLLKRRYKEKTTVSNIRSNIGIDKTVINRKKEKRERKNVFYLQKRDKLLLIN